jgi:hypothetical protein
MSVTAEAPSDVTDTPRTGAVSWRTRTVSAVSSANAIVDRRIAAETHAHRIEFTGLTRDAAEFAA